MTQKKTNFKSLFAELKEKEFRLLDIYINGLIDKETYNSKKTEINAKKQKLQERADRYAETSYKISKKTSLIHKNG